MLESTGFGHVEFIDKDNSDDIIRNWRFGEGVEKAVRSFYIKARKPAV